MHMIAFPEKPTILKNPSILGLDTIQVGFTVPRSNLKLPPKIDQNDVTYDSVLVRGYPRPGGRGGVFGLSLGLYLLSQVSNLEMV